MPRRRTMGDRVSRLGPPSSRFTKTPNALLDALARVGAAMPARHRSIVEFLVREMLGWHCDALAVSQRTIASRLRVSPRTVRAAVEDLERWRVLRRRGAGRGRVAVFELRDPREWRISKTAGAIRVSERRRRLRDCDQPLLPFEDVAAVLDFPTQIRGTSRDTRGDVPRRLVAALYKKRKKSKGVGISQPGDTVPMALTRPGDRMPNDEPQKPTPLELAEIRATRAARARIRRLHLGDPFDLDLLKRVAAELTPEDVAEEIRLRELETADEHEARQHRLQADAMRHEGRR
ncbi:MAG: replication protein [Proteobacteria bacterium]|nr:replication protein [Pseudomonadota bacterium]